jgi:hypothetical protein
VKLADLRSIAIRQHYRIRFSISDSLECVINQHGVAQVPGLRGVPDFNLERELEPVSQFLLEPAVPGPKDTAPTRLVTREELAAMAGSSPVATAAEHEEE